MCAFFLQIVAAVSLTGRGHISELWLASIDFMLGAPMCIYMVHCSTSELLCFMAVNLVGKERASHAQQIYFNFTVLLCKCHLVVCIFLWFVTAVFLQHLFFFCATADQFGPHMSFPSFPPTDLVELAVRDYRNGSSLLVQQSVLIPWLFS